jgi:hypothetical protein
METVSTGPFMMRSTCRWVDRGVAESCLIAFYVFLGDVLEKVLTTRTLVENAEEWARPIRDRK